MYGNLFGPNYHFLQFVEATEEERQSSFKAKVSEQLWQGDLFLNQMENIILFFSAQTDRRLLIKAQLLLVAQSTSEGWGRISW